jgi:ERCC4-type nuclease
METIMSNPEIPAVEAAAIGMELDAPRILPPLPAEPITVPAPSPSAPDATTAVVVILDAREKPNLLAVFEERAAQLAFVRESLTLGDIEFRRNTVGGAPLLRIERKTVHDMAISIKSKHWRNQKLRLMSQLAECPVAYLIEGSWRNVDAHYQGLGRSSMLAALVNTYVRDGLQIFRTENEVETWELVSTLSQKLLEVAGASTGHGTASSGAIGLGRLNGQAAGVSSYAETVKAAKAKNMTPAVCMQVMLTQIPGMSTAAARQLQDIYPSMRDLVSAYAACSGAKERDNMLADVMLSLGKKPGGKRRRLGPAVSARIAEYIYGGAGTK